MKQKGWHSRGYLPHFDAEGVVQHVVLHTRNALTREFYDGVRDLEPTQKRKRFDEALDASDAGRIFGNPRCAHGLESQLLYFDGERYDLLAWCIMPNHVHVVMCCLNDISLGQIVRTWKVQTTATVNAMLGTKGPIFAPDYFGRFMRNGKQAERAIGYVENNPVTAGLCRDPAERPYSSAYSRSNSWNPKTDNLPSSLY
jgi:REP element-mobilizing transposase RayT